MAKLGSEFLKEFNHFEKPSFFKSPKRLVVFVAGVLLGAGLSFLLVLYGYPNFLIYLLMGLLLPPLALYVTGKDDVYREKLKHYLTIKERSYQTHFIHRKGDLTKDDFKQSSKRSETQTDQG